MVVYTWPNSSSCICFSVNTLACSNGVNKLRLNQNNCVVLINDLADCAAQQPVFGRMSLTTAIVLCEKATLLTSIVKPNARTGKHTVCVYLAGLQPVTFVTRDMSHTARSYQSGSHAPPLSPPARQETWLPGHGQTPSPRNPCSMFKWRYSRAVCAKCTQVDAESWPIQVAYQCATAIEYLALPRKYGHATNNLTFPSYIWCFIS